MPLTVFGVVPGVICIVNPSLYGLLGQELLEKLQRCRWKRPDNKIALWNVESFKLSPRTRRRVKDRSDCIVVLLFLLTVVCCNRNPVLRGNCNRSSLGVTFHRHGGLELS